MDTAPAARPIPLFLTMLVAFFSALAALSIANGHDARAHDDARQLIAAPATPSHVAAVGLKELALRNRMRELWEDHITWTRLAIIGLTAGSPDTPAAVARLLKNQTDIGNAIKPFYGERSGNALTRQLRNHILIAADLVMAAKAADEARLAAVRARWETNADAIAMVLASVNPRSWPPARMRSELRTHLRLTTDEAVARIRGDWTADVAAYDSVHRHALHFADLLSAGVVRQFPKRFR